MLIWPLLFLGALLAGIGLAGVVWWWPDPLRCCAGVGLILGGAVLDLVAATAHSARPDGEVAALVLLVLGSVRLAAVSGRRRRTRRAQPEQ